MGMDVHGLNPKQNKNIDDFPTMKKFDSMEFSEKWKKLDKNEKLKNKYWEEKNKWEKGNPGVYFRNNCWWWRPLWNYCYAVADDIIPEEVYSNGHCNDGAGLDADDAELLGKRLLETIDSGECLKYQAKYMEYQENSDDEFASSYPFDIDNVKNFANFCIESGGFEIC